MLGITRAIVFRATKYSENSLVIKLYTEVYGLRSYLVGSVHGKKSKAALFLPMNLLELVANHNEKSKLIRPREVRLLENLQQVYADITKQSILLFINEIAYKAIKEEEPNEKLFHFLLLKIMQLEHETSGIAVFHIRFMIEISKILGFFPQGKYSDKTPFFDLNEGTFCAETSNFTIDRDSSNALGNCLLGEYQQLKSKEVRNNLIEKLILYFSLHIEGFTKINSFDVLKSLSAD